MQDPHIEAGAEEGFYDATSTVASAHHFVAWRIEQMLSMRSRPNDNLAFFVNIGDTIESRERRR
jgi:hypothetical protein